MTYYIGIDPGKDGGIAALHKSGKIHSYQVMPKTHYDLYHCLKEWQSKLKHIALEKAQAMPKNGAVSMFNYGVNYGAIKGILVALEIPFTEVPPAQWSKVMCAGIDRRLKTKERSLTAAQNLFPDQTFLKSTRSSKPHSGIYEAILIAEYARRTFK